MIKLRLLTLILLVAGLTSCSTPQTNSDNQGGRPNTGPSAVPTVATNTTKFRLPEVTLKKGDKTLDLKDGGEILVQHDLTVEVTYTTKVDADNCHNASQTFAEAFMTPAGQPEAPFLSIGSVDLFGSTGDCRAEHHLTKTATPLGPTEGLYTLRFHSSNYHFLVGFPFTEITYTPKIKITADGRVVVDVTYSPPAQGATEINNQWQIRYKKP
jgi:hypothetical protein